MMTTITEYLVEQKRLAEAATEGPWIADQPGMWGDDSEVPQCAVRVVDGGNITWDDHAGEVFKPADAAFIAAARESVPRLVAALEAVAEIHRRVGASWPHNGGTFVCAADNGIWPCPTIRAIEAALGGEGR